MVRAAAPAAAAADPVDPAAATPGAPAAPAAPAKAATGALDPAVAAMSPFARQQVAALQQEKAQRTPAEKKMDSNLVLLAKQSRGELPAEISHLQLTATPDAAGLVLVDLATKFEGNLPNVIRDAGGQVINRFPAQNAIRAKLPVNSLATIAGREEVRTIRPADQGVTNTVTSQGDTAHGANLARSSWGANGAGVRIGVLSDGVDYLSNSVTNGELGTVTVISGQAGSGSEGTAMLEIIHDLAPGADLYFATATGGAAAMANNIATLAAPPYNCNIIVDDYSYFLEAPFQDDTVARTVATVSSNGVLYFSAAGNFGNTRSNSSGTWEGDFNQVGTYSFPGTLNGKTISAWPWHRFGGTDNYNMVTSATNPNTGSPDQAAFLFWSDPLGGSGNDYDLLAVDASGTVVAASTNTQDGNDDPLEYVGVNNGQRLLVIRNPSAAARFLHLDLRPQGPYAAGTLQYHTNGGARGHNASAADNAFSVAATSALAPAPNAQFDTTDTVETFSSDGPRRMFYYSNGTAITPGNFLAGTSGGQTFNKPDLTAADHVATSVPAFPDFTGTSAAAPHAAAIAALIRSFNSNITNTQIRQILNGRALDILDPGFDPYSGNGIVMARLLVPTVTLTSATNFTSTSATLNGTVNPNFSNTTASFQYGLTTSYGSSAPVTVSPANGGTAQNVSANVPGLQADTTYHYRLTATNLGGTANTNDSTFRTNQLSVTFASASTVGISSPGYTITSGATVGLTLGYAPTPGTALVVINNTASSSTPISGRFANLSDGSTLNLFYNSVSYSFLVNYAGGDGNDLTLTCLGLPAASVSTTGNVTSGNVQVMGLVNPNGTQTTVVCEYGVSGFTSSTSPTTLPAGFSNQAVSFSVPVSFQQTITYHFKATNSFGTTYSSPETVTANTLAASFTSASSIPLTVTTAPNLTGANVQLSLGFQAGALSSLTLINNTSGSPIVGTFGNLANGSVITTTYNGNQVAFIAYYDGGDGNDLVLTRVPATGQKTIYTWDSFVGPLGGADGCADGPALTARFGGGAYDGVYSVAAHPDGSVYVGDKGLIRKITPDGYVITLVGDRHNPGFQDGPLSQATIKNPHALHIDASGNLIFIDDYALVRKITPDGTISTIASFDEPIDLTICGGSIYVSDYSNNQGYIRKIDPAGNITTFAGGGSNFTHATDPLQVFLEGSCIASDGVDKIYVAEYAYSTIRQIAPNTSVPGTYSVTRYAGAYGVSGTTTNVPRLQARFSNLSSAMTVAANGTIYVSDGWAVRKVPVSTTANVTNMGAVNTAGYVDGTGTAARFGYILGLAAAQDGTNRVFVTHEDNGAVRLITTTTSAVTTFAGGHTLAGTTNSTTPTSVRFDGPEGIAWHPSGFLLTSDWNNHGIRKITTAGATTTAAGALGTAGHVDGAPTSARFQNPSGLAIDSAGNAYVADQSNAAVRKLATGTFTVSRFAGAYDVPGNADGDALTVARFNQPVGLSIDPLGVIYLTDYGYSSLRKISRPNISSPYTVGTLPVTVLSGLSNAVAGFGNHVYYSMAGHSVGDVDTVTGAATIYAGSLSTAGWVDGPVSSARFSFPTPQVFDRTQGTITSEWDQVERTARIRLLDLNGQASTIFGVVPQPRGEDILGAEVELGYVGGIALAPDHSLYVTDVYSNRVIHGVPTFSPLVRLSGATATSSTTVDIDVVVNTNGSPATVYCDLGTSPTGIVASSSGVGLSNSASDQSLPVTVSGLTSNTVYYYRARAVNADGAGQTRVGWFKTP